MRAINGTTSGGLACTAVVSAWAAAICCHDRRLALSAVTPSQYDMLHCHVTCHSSSIAFRPSPWASGVGSFYVLIIPYVNFLYIYVYVTFVLLHLHSVVQNHSTYLGLYAMFTVVCQHMLRASNNGCCLFLFLVGMGMSRSRTVVVF